MNYWDNLIMKATSIVSTSCHFDEGILTKSAKVYLFASKFGHEWLWWPEMGANGPTKIGHA